MPEDTPLTAEDRFAIQDLYSRYSWALDTGNVDDFVGCFTADAIIREEVFEDPDTWEGADGIRALAEHYRNAPNFPGRQHHSSMLQIDEVNGLQCRARSFVFVTECQGEPPFLLRFTGYYEDLLDANSGRWLFKERAIRLWDGPVLKNFPGKGDYVPRVRPPELVVKRRN